jgi:hypothetical protein
VSIPESIQAEFLSSAAILARPQPVPAVYLFDDTRSGLSAAIRSHQQGDYSHCGTGLGFMVKNAPVVVDQVATLRLSPLAAYLSPEYRVKCVELLPPPWGRTWFDARVVVAQAEARRVLGLAWWRRLYDVLGVLAAGIGLRHIGQPSDWYCSEAVAHFVTPILADNTYLRLVDHPTPAEINTWLKAQIDYGRARVAWRYDPDEIA